MTPAEGPDMLRKLNQTKATIRIEARAMAQRPLFRSSRPMKGSTRLADSREKVVSGNVVTRASLRAIC